MLAHVAAPVTMERTRGHPNIGTLHIILNELSVAKGCMDGRRCNIDTTIYERRAIRMKYRGCYH